MTGTALGTVVGLYVETSILTGAGGHSLLEVGFKERRSTHARTVALALGSAAEVIAASTLVDAIRLLQAARLA